MQDVVVHKVFEANTSTHTLRDTRIKRIYITNWGGDNNGTNTHSCYALDTDGELWAGVTMVTVN